MKLKLAQVPDLIGSLLLTSWIITLPFEKQHILAIAPYFPVVSVYLSDILGLLLLFYLLVFTRNNAFPTLKRPHTRFFVVILGIFTISWLFSPRETINTYIFLKWAGFLMLGWLLIPLLKKQGIKTLVLNSIVAAGLIQTLIAITQFIIQKSLGLKLFGEPNISTYINGVAKIDLIGEKVIRAYGTFAHPNQLSAFLFVACATCIWLFIKQRGWKYNYIYIAALIILLIGEVTTFSRIGILVTYIFLGFTLLTLWLKRSAVFKPVILAVLLTTIFAGVIFNPYLRSRADQQTPEIYNRTLYNTEGLKLFNEKPITGVGIGQTRKEMSLKISHQEEWQIQVPHNFFILVSSETGLPGLSAFMLLFFYLTKGLLRKIKENKGEQLYILTFTLFGVLLLMQFDHYFYTLQQTQLLLLLLVGIIISEITDNNPDVQERKA